jgi:hypothetical protein
MLAFERIRVLLLVAVLKTGPPWPRVLLSIFSNTCRPDATSRFASTVKP